MAKVNIIIKGIAMSYHKGDDIWKILFPFGDCHEVRFKENENEDGIKLAKPGRQIQITAKNPTSQFGEGDNYKDFIDLTDKEYSHAQGVKRKDGWEDRSVFMSIENAVFSVDAYTGSPHMLSKDGEITFAPKEIGYSGKLEIEADEVIVNIDDNPEFPRSYTTDSTIIFDNDCNEGDSREESDFDMLYNVVESAVSNEGKFVAAKIKPAGPLPIEIDKIVEGESDDKFRDPSLWGDLPCHKVRISQPGDLP